MPQDSQTQSFCLVESFSHCSEHVTYMEIPNENNSN